MDTGVTILRRDREVPLIPWTLGWFKENAILYLVRVKCIFHKQSVVSACDQVLATRMRDSGNDFRHSHPEPREPAFKAR